MFPLPLGVAPYGETQQQLSPPTTWTWGMSYGNRMTSPSHQMTGNVGGILLESNTTPFWFVATDLDRMNIDNVNKELHLPTYFTTYWAGYTGLNLSNRKRGILVFRDGLKMVVDDVLTTQRQGNFLTNSTSDNTVPSYHDSFSLPTISGSGRFHFLPIDGCIPDFTQSFYTLISGSNLIGLDGISVGSLTYNKPSWASTSTDMRAFGDQSLLFVNGLTLTHQLDYVWLSPTKIQLLNSYGIDPTTINQIELYILSPRKIGRPRHMYQRNIQNQNNLVFRDFPTNVQFLGKV